MYLVPFLDLLPYLASILTSSTKLSRGPQHEVLVLPSRQLRANFVYFVHFVRTGV